MIQHYDIAVLYWINHAWAHPWCDRLFIFVTELRNFIVPGLAGIGFLLIKGGTKGRRVALCLVIGIAFSDNVSSRIIKPIVGRIRPCQALVGLRLPHGDRGTLSFPSGHATNIATAVTIVSMSYPPASGPLIALAILVGLSRVYLGLHYPTDVLGGFLLGAFIGWLVVIAQRKLNRRNEARESGAGAPA